MTSPIQILARNMEAAATAPSEDDENVYLLEESEGELVQQLWVNNEPKIKTLVTEGVMKNTPALYLIDKSRALPKRLIFFLDDSQHFKCVEYNEDDEEWEDTPFSDELSKIDVHPTTQMSGVSNEWGMMIILETKPGRLEVLVGSENKWLIIGTIPIQTSPGAAHMVLDYQEKIHLFCFGNDDQIHHLIQPYGEQGWKASIVKNSKLEVAPSRIVAFPREDESSFDLYILLSNSQLIRIEFEGDKTDLGVASAPQWVRLSPEFWSEKYLKEPEVVIGNGTNIENLHIKKTFIVKLTFNQPTACSGTGFFVNIPRPNVEGDKKERTMFPRIILTAAHNLIGNDKQLSRDLEIEYCVANDRDDKESFANNTMKVTNDQIFISEKYKDNPGPHNSMHDWGFLILGEEPYPRGFGLSLLFSLTDQDMSERSLLRRVLQKNGVHILGHSDAGDNQITSGPGIISTTGEIEYEAETKKGISGSPVWVPYEGLATVIAIHAYGPERSRRSRGTRISFGLLQELYSQARLVYFSRALKAVRVPIPKPGVVNYFPKGVYLHFPCINSRAKVHYGNIGLHTTFDIIPALTHPSPSATVQHAFLLHEAGGNGNDKMRWVLWNVETNKVTAIDHIHPACLVELIPGKQSTKSFQVAIPKVTGKNKTVILLLGAQRLQIEDEELGIPAVSSEVSMVEINCMQVPPKLKDHQFNHFRFESVGAGPKPVP
ncbi:hypothetical protein GQX73_g7584 [Xylaria multiplex]|uniref:Serine protease n=1 Tax=Xylaria multiplex TaxID=323545 RepID=A0A7C8MUR1_9PEZI|nr:hypothetical protein GQX73_g7584 [Xylaria multiplex]